MSIELADFRLLQCVLELKYADRPLIWDHAGQFWTTIIGQYPKARVQSSQPNQTTMQLDERTSGVAGINRSGLTVDEPGTDLELLLKPAELLIAQLVESLIVDTYSRIGLRLFFERKFKSREEAAAYMLSNAPVAHPSGKHFNIEGRVYEPQLSFRWESPKVGCRVLCKAETVKIDIQFPYEYRQFQPPADAREKHRVMVDVDYYTLADTPARMVRISDLVQGWARAIKRDLRGVLGG